MVMRLEKKKIIFMIGSPNQTTQMHRISTYLSDEFDCWFTQFYPDNIFEKAVLKFGFMEQTIMSGHTKAKADKYLLDHGLKNDYTARLHDYDMAVLCTDLLVPHKLRRSKMVWVQEGMIDKVTHWSKVINKSRIIPRYLTVGTSLNGSSNICDIYCAGSAAYRDFFVSMGTDRDKITVTGIPNFDDLQRYQHNDFPLKDYVLVATSDIRECFGQDDRMGFLQRCKQIVGSRRVLFKLHPNEIKDRAVAEIRSVFGIDAEIHHDGKINEMVANCEELITQYSTVVYVGIVLGKKVHSYFDIDELYRLSPIQNNGASARHVAEICREYMVYEGTGAEFLRAHRPLA
jgi:hypothetical protein